MNYLVRRPSVTPTQSIELSLRTHSFLRGTFDVTGPLDRDKKVVYRVAGTLQSMNDHTDYFKEDHFFISPSLLWTPLVHTEVYFDVEYGEQNQGGIGARQVRSVADVGINNDQKEHGGFYTPPVTNPRTYRVTGPDTYLDSQASNMELKVTQRMLEDVDFLAAYNF